ncbi:hypothetical protein OAO55_00785 [Bacteroidales bacterium]|nr:hypothetical protein [Bacteroidales bacterium]
MVSDNEVDTVSVGSLMPYAVDRDPNVAAMATRGILQPSQFNWQVTGANNKIDFGTFNSSTGLYENDSITVSWGQTTGSFEVSTAENSIRNDIILCADETPSVINIEIIDLPEVGFVDSVGGACTSADILIPLRLKGYGPWDITYDITFTNLQGTKSVISTGTEKQVGEVSNKFDDTSSDLLDLPVLTDELGFAQGNYTITITQIDDRFTNKSLIDINGNVDLENNSFDIFLYPTPNTSPIKHIKN